MSNITSTLAKRLHAHSISLPIASTQRAVFSNALDVDAAKQRAADWEPSVKFEGLNTKSKTRDDDDNEQEIAYMATYSVFDPGATHPLLLSSAFPISVSDLAGNASVISIQDFEIKTRRNTVIANSPLQTPSTASSLHHALEVQQAAPALTLEKFKPWPYSLPKPLQPKAGTTYDLMYGDGLGDGYVAKVKLGLLQKVLYGVPEPEKKDEEEG